MMEPQADMTKTVDRPAHRQVLTDVVDERILVMTADRVHGALT